MADCSDPQIDEAYQDVRSDKSETNWLLLDYESDRSDTLKLTSTGSGGLDELRDRLDESKASFAYVRVQYANDKESKREHLHAYHESTYRSSSVYVRRLWTPALSRRLRRDSVFSECGMM
ncbi:hypothetical protein B0H21DRAFT_697969 [Amylocystis lapponica]|nr:hypothetical protein B0H21DRAFT_697969 [Amylocystis lapponica]